MKHPGARTLLAAASVTLMCLAALSRAEDHSWRQAEGIRSWSFPDDHGAHRFFQTEWWYFTGNLSDPSGAPLGYQLTFFRTGIRKEPVFPGNPWSVGDLFLAHFALTDARGNRFFYRERISRAGPGLAGAEDRGLHVWLWDWKAASARRGFQLSASSGEMSLDLTLVPGKPPILHGTQGLSFKGPRPGQASYYYSMTDLRTRGFVRLPGGERVEVDGTSWFDHEFGSNQLAEDQDGWDWFGLRLSDGTGLMLYLLRRKDGTVEAASSGTFIDGTGVAEHLDRDEFSVLATGSWTSPRTGGVYPSGWHVRVPGKGVDITVTPLVLDQELITQATAGIIYWEGAVTIQGRTGDGAVTGQGYVELTGYAGSLGGIF